MKLLIAIFFFHICSYSQNLIGEWKLVSFQDEKIYYNIEKDSIFPKDSWNENDEMTIFVKNAFRNTNIKFTKAKYFVMNSQITGNRNSKYELDQKNSIIILEDENIDNSKIQYHYILEDYILNLKLADNINLKFRKKD